MGSLLFIFLSQTLENFFIAPKKPKTISCTLFHPPLEISNFNLNNVYENKNFNKQSLKGHWNLIFFGYTDCPDICPNTMEIIKDIWNNLEKDTDKSIKRFLIKYNENFIGLNGEKDQIIL